MHIVYLDESGTHKEARYFVVAGLAVFERETFFLTQSLDQLQARYFPDADEPITFHATVLRAPEGMVAPPFDTLTQAQRRTMLGEVYDIIAGSHARVFAVAMEKAAIRDEEPYERGFEEIINRFDRMLGRILRDRGEPQRGLLILAESSYRENLRTLAEQIWSKGHRWGATHNLADVPFFAPARSTRLLQLADFVANAVFGRYENGYTRDFDKVASKADREGGRLHGLVHITLDHRGCMCPPCVSYRAQPRPEIDDEDITPTATP